MAEFFDARLSVSSLRAPARLPWATENRRRWRLFGAPEPENADLMLIRTQFSHRFATERVAVASHGATGAGDERSFAINANMFANRWRGMATSAIWNATYRPWLTTFAPILISFSRSVVNEAFKTSNCIGKI